MLPVYEHSDNSCPTRACTQAAAQHLNDQNLALSTQYDMKDLRTGSMTRHTRWREGFGLDSVVL